MSYDLLRFSLLFRRFVTVKADDSVPPFFTESEFRTLHLFRAPPSLITKQPNRPTLRGGSTQSPEAKRAGFVSALKFAKAVACGYSEGAGFVVLTEPSPWPLALLLWVRCTTRRRGDGEVCPRAPRVCALGCLYSRLGHHWHTQPGPSAEATATASGRRRVLPTA